MLGANYAAASRLNYQHYLWRETLRFSIHPSIPVPEEARIADVATGTAIWLIDVTHEHPAAQLDGFDIDMSQAPPKQWLNPKIALKTWNIFDRVPDDMIGVYDVVHVRMLVLVVQNSDPRNIIRNLFQMLKPGGYLQWDDLNYHDVYVKTSDSSLSTPALDRFHEMIYSNGRSDWALHLSSIFAEEGLVENKLYHFQDPPELAKANGDQWLLAVEEFASTLAKTHQGDGANKILQIIQDASKEVLEGAAIVIPRVVCVGRKPSMDSKI